VARSPHPSPRGDDTDLRVSSGVVIHRHDEEAGVRRILGVLSLAKKHGPEDVGGSATGWVTVPVARVGGSDSHEKPERILHAG